MHKICTQQSYSFASFTKLSLLALLFLQLGVLTAQHKASLSFKASIEDAIQLSKSDQTHDAKRNLDSLAKAIESAPDSIKTTLTFQIAKGYNSINDHESAALLLEGLVLEKDVLKDSITLSQLLYSLGLSYKNLGLVAASRDAFMRCMILCESLHDEIRLGLTLNQIGLLEKKSGNYPNAIAYLERALKLFSSINNLKQTANIYNNIGSAYKLSNDYGRAKEYLLKAIAINKKLSNNKSLSYNYNNLGNLYEEMGNLTEAEDYHLKSVEIKREINDFPMLASSYSNLALVHEKRGDTRLAMTYANMAHEIAFKERINDILPIVLEQQARLHAAQGSHSKSYQVLNKLVRYQDSLAGENKKALTRLYERNMTTRKSESNKNLSENDNPTSESNNWLVTILIGLCLAMLFTVLLLFYSSHKRRTYSKQKLNIHKNSVLSLRKQIQTLQKSNNDLVARIEKTEHDKDVFFSTVSHDMRGPLNAINAIVSMLKKQVSNEKKDNEEIIVLDYSVRSLIALTDDILDFSYIESGRLRIEHKPFSLNELLADMLEAFEFISNEKEIDLIAEIENIPQKIIGDPRRLKQVLFNLLQNAFKFTRDGYVRIVLKSNEADQNHRKIKLEIEDTGIGISKIRLNDVFDQFFQINPEEELDKGGSGLGLYISKSLVEQMGGNLMVQSKVDEGSTFTIDLTLPIAHRP